MKKKNHGFTLIELITVLVIMAIITLIVTPLVMNIIRKSKVSARKRSVDAYGRAVELAIATHLLDTGTFPLDLHNLNIEYSGQTVVCNVMQMKENGGLYLSECTVNNKEVKDSSTDDGWYHYGVRDLTNEEYVNMYGDALKTASLAYYQANNRKVSDYRTLNIDYNGKDISCDVTINYDGTVYLTDCSVAGTNVTDENNEDGYYHYGNIKYKSYSVGDTVSYNNVDYYVIADSDASKDTVTLLKAEPLTVDEVNRYGGVGTENNHVNMYTSSSVGKAYDFNGYGSMAYYSSSSCGTSGTSGCTTDYSLSEIKYVVDAWAAANTNLNDLVVDFTNYKARLITIDELRSDLGYGTANYRTENVPIFIYASHCSYWTMVSNRSSSSQVWYIDNAGDLFVSSVYYSFGGIVRPVITLSKLAL